MPSETAGVDARVGDSLTETLRESFIAGSALLIPIVVTVFIVAFALNFVSQALAPIVDAVGVLFTDQPPAVLIELASVFALVCIVLVVGFVAEATSGERLASGFHAGMEAIPGVGTVYSSFRRMSDVIVESDTDNFQEVKLVEFPNDGTYSIAFVTAGSIDAVEDATNSEDVLTLFVPFAPNPVMGGQLVYVPAERTYDVDMSVEEAVSALVTSGVAADEAEE